MRHKILGRGGCEKPNLFMARGTAAQYYISTDKLTERKPSFLELTVPMIKQEARGDLLWLTCLVLMSVRHFREKEISVPTKTYLFTRFGGERRTKGKMEAMLFLAS